MKECIVTSSAPPPAGAYSHGVVANGFLYTAGQGPLDAHGELVGDSIEPQTRQVMENLLIILRERGLDLADVVKVTVHLQDLARDFVGFNNAYSSYFTGNFPARTTVGSNLMNILVEIDVVAGLQDTH